MLPTDRIPTLPGEILVEEFLRPMGVTQVKFAEHLGIPIQRVNEIATGKRGVTPETAILFGVALGTTPEFWIYLQAAHDLALARSRVERMPKALEPTARARGKRKSAPSTLRSQNRWLAVQREAMVARKKK